MIAHRGASGHAPENTIAAFRRAVELGAMFIETDLHLTRDAELVAIHDTTLERTTNGTGAVKKHTLAELRELDAGAWFSPEFAGEKIPTLEEIAAFAREQDVVFFLELRADAAWGAEHALVAALRRVGEAARTAVLSYFPSALATVLKLDPTLMTGFLFSDPIPEVVEKAVAIGARQIAPEAPLATPELVAEAHARDLQVLTWTVNDPAEMKR
ncbi:MAG TPA: glycerophosphodiester phosphodiesterase family protein, partial [Candidatus Acidoferrales bacterium]